MAQARCDFKASAETSALTIYNTLEALLQCGQHIIQQSPTQLQLSTGLCHTGD